MTNMAEYLSFQANILSSTLPTQLGNLVKFTLGMKIKGNDITGPLPSQLGRLTGITKSLQLRSMSVTGSVSRGLLGLLVPAEPADRRQ